MLNLDNFLLLTKQSGILKPFAIVLGFIMNAIFWVLDKIGIFNVGVVIIIFTFVVYILMFPLTYKQQKYSKLMNKINPEINAITAKYEGKKDQDSMMKANQERQAVFEKYGVNPMGSCLPLLIQMPILFALYRVIYNMPAYIGKIRDIYTVLAAKIVSTDNGAFISTSEKLANTVKVYGKNMVDGNMENGIIDVLNRLSSSEMAEVAEHYNLNGLTYDLSGKTQEIISSLDASGNVANVGILDNLNNFLGLNIVDSPMFIIKNQWSSAGHGSKFVIILAILIPLIAGFTQWLNSKLIPQPENTNNSASQSDMASSMKYMNNIMPIFSIFMCFSFSVGIGIYWIFSALVRGIIQVCINKHIDKIDIDKMIEENIERINKRNEKYGLPSYQVASNATKNTRNIEVNKPSKPSLSKEQKDALVKESTEYYKNANVNKPGSLAAKANMVKLYNEKNNKKD